MNDAFKKIFVTTAALVGMLAGYVHGDDFSSSYEINDNSECTSSNLCDPQPCCEPSCCGKSFVCADFLYLRPYEGGIAVCGRSSSADVINPDGTVNSFFRGKRHDPNFKWEPGFRIGAGYEFSNCWFTAAYWMHFDAKAHRHGGDENHFRWKLDFDVVDVVIGNEYQFGDCLILKPYVGVRGARIDQKSRSFEISTEHFVTTDGSHNKSKFTGVGGLAGAELNWNIGYGFGIYGNTAISSLWGRFKVRFDDFHVFPGGGEFSTQRDHLEACELVLDSALGLSWTKCFCNNRKFMLKIGVEQHRYFNHNRIGTYGDLCLAGGFLSAGLEF